MNKEKNDLKVKHHSHVMDYDNNEISVDHYKTDQYICIYCEQWNLQSSFDIQYYYHLLIYFHKDMWYENTFTMNILDKCESVHPEYDILENISSSNEKKWWWFNLRIINLKIHIIWLKKIICIRNTCFWFEWFIDI